LRGRRRRGGGQAPSGDRGRGRLLTPRPGADGKAPEASSDASRTRVRVRYPETDRMGVVHHSHYLTWFEVGRTEWMRDRGRSYAEMEKDGIFMPVVEARCRYLASARYDEEIEIETRLAEATRIRIEFRYAVSRAADGRLLAEGSTVHV